MKGQPPMTIEITPADEYLDRLKYSLGASAVLKAELAELKSTSGDAFIFAFEGATDTIAYSHWIGKISPRLDYEPFICRNKNKLLQLLDSLELDLGGLAENVYFILDRDFDDLKGRRARSNVFMTDKYSIENYLICPILIDELLKVEFHCHGNRALRIEIAERFDALYCQFLAATAAINFRIFLARRLSIQQLGDLPSRLNEIANVNLNASDSTGDPRVLVRLLREPSEEEINIHRPEFDQLDPKSRYRGKFAILFFIRWLSLLQAERNSKKSSMFGSLAQDDFAAKGNFDFNLLAARSQPSNSFRKFIEDLETK
jgi:hypothetical protein